MSYSDLLTPRRDVLSEAGIEGIIDLANVDDPRRRKLESRPADFLSLTYPTADARRVVETLHRRFSGDRDAPGLFLFEGLKGSGKSHLLLMVYHLFANPDTARGWLGQHGLRCDLSPDAAVVINKFTDLPLYSIWDFVFERLTGKKPAQSALQPGLAEVKSVLGDRALVLILDELERGIHLIPDRAAREQNIAFLQMLSEWSNRENRVTLLASVYSDQEEPGSTLKRVPSCRVRFEHATDKARIVLHRLFENYLDSKQERARPVVESYVASWRRHSAVQGDSLQSRLAESFPFSPDVLELILDRVPARGGFQSVRGALGFLARLVKLTYLQADIITPAHADLTDQEIAVRLADLDLGGDLIRGARENLKELVAYPLVGSLGSAVMLYTLSGSGRERGATREELVRSVCTPSIDINDFEQALNILQRYASHLFFQESRYFFDPEENADAKVEFRSLLIDSTGAKAKGLIAKLWREELFREPESAVVLTDIEKTKEALEALEKGRLRFVLSPRRLKAEERHVLYHGLAERNQVVLLEPKDSAFDAFGDKDLIKWAQRVLSAEDLATSAMAARKAEYERIGREDKGNILGALRRAGLVYIRVEKHGAIPAEDKFEEEGLGSVVTKEDVVNKLNQEIYPPQLIAEHLRGRLGAVGSRAVKDVDRDYRTILGFPVPTHATSVSRAVRILCADGRLGVRHTRGDFSGRDPDLTESELANATLDAPFERVRVPSSPSPGPLPSQPAPGAQPLVPVPATPPQGIAREIVVPAQATAWALRLELASRLQALDSAVVSRARFTIFLESSSGDLSALPAALRGSLSGAGKLTAEITIVKEQVGTKGDVEQAAERLPSVPGATYSARIEVLVSEGRSGKVTNA